MEIKEQIQQKFDTDPAFAAALKEAKNAEEAMKALQAAGFQLTEEEFKGMFKADSVALSDDELDKVDGGLHLHIPYIKYGQMIVPEED